MFYSIRWRFVLIYLLLIAIALGVVSVAVSSVMGNYILEQRVGDQQKSVDSIAVQVAPYLDQSDASGLYQVAVNNYQNVEGRMLVLNSSGIVQTDSFSELNGTRLSISEVNDILYGQNSSSFGYHQIYDEAEDSHFWSLYCSSSVVSDGSVIGVVLSSVYIQDAVDAIDGVQQQMLMIYIVACLGIIILGMIFSNFVTKPVVQLTDAALKISAGDLKSRVNIKGKNEIAELGQTFNMMCGRLENIDRQRSEFVSDASHELKTPLASMKILVESLLYQDGVQEEVYKDFLSDINGEIDRLNDLITDLLLISKMDSDIMTMHLETVSIKEIITKCVAVLNPIAQTKDIEVTMQLQDDPLIIEGDALKLRQAFNNLVENAIKYTKNGGHVLLSSAKQGHEIIVKIEDDGVGMSEEHLPHIFDRFYRVDKARSRETGGTGLGLHIVRRIALLHGGRVEVSSSKGVGSTFTIIFPINPVRGEKEDMSKNGRTVK